MTRLVPYHEQMERNRRLAANLPNLVSDGDREAARRLFSILANLEEIAVLAAERGDGVEGQLDDELAHRDTFREIAESLGGAEPMPSSIRDLYDYLTSLRGQSSLAVLNVVAEAWLENVFHFVAPLGPWAALLEQIEAEEARHSQEALRSARVEPSTAAPLVRALEDHLFQVTVDPHFMWPLAYLSSVPAIAKMGQRALDMHARSVRALGVEPGPAAKDIAACGREGLDDIEPMPIDSTLSQEAMFNARVPPIGAHLAIPWSGSRAPAVVEARVVRAVSWVLRENPELDRSIDPRGGIWQPAAPTVGVRRLWGDSSDHVMTLYSRNADALHQAELEGKLAEQTDIARARPYIRTPALPDQLLALAPPSRCSATVTVVTPFFPPGARGESRLSPLEGPTWSVCATSFERRGWRRTPHLWLWVECDHRVHNGRELGRFLSELQDILA